MRKADPSSRRRIASFLILGLLIPACHRERGDKTQVAAAPAATQPMSSPAPATLDRADLIRAMAAAAEQYAMAAVSPEDPLVGRRFVIRQSFACPGALAGADGAPDGLTHWKPTKAAVQYSLSPEDWTRSVLIDAAKDDWEAVEGIWLTRPWILADECPKVTADPLASGPSAPSRQTMGLASVFEKSGSRLGARSGRPFIYVDREKGISDMPDDGGLRLVLEGRVVAFADGRAIHCRTADPDQRPVCVVAVRLDRVAFERASGALLSQWQTSQAG